MSSRRLKGSCGGVRIAESVWKTLPHRRTAKARWPYVLSGWRGTCSRFRSAERGFLWVYNGTHTGTEVPDHWGIDGPWLPAWTLLDLGRQASGASHGAADWALSRIYQCRWWRARQHWALAVASQWGLRSTGKNRITVVDSRGDEGTNELIQRPATIVSAVVDGVGKSSVPQLSRRVDKYTISSICWFTVCLTKSKLHLYLDRHTQRYT